MSVPFDADMLSFLWVNLKVILGSKGHLRQNTRPIPMRFEFEEFSPDRLTGAQLEYLKPIDAQLAALNYFPLCTFRVRNYGTNLLRRYANPADRASCALTIVEVKVNVKSVQSVNNASLVEFTTRFSDGRRLTTRNMAQKSLMDQPPDRIVQDFPNVTNLADLKRKHDARAQDLGVPLSPPQDVDAVFNEVQAEHERFSNYQLERGIYATVPQGGAYVVTDKVLNRGIRNHFLPVGSRMSLTRLIFTALVGAVLPLLGILWLSPLLAPQHPGNPDPWLGSSPLAILGCYTLAGAIIGYAGESQKFNWVFSITYLPAHLVAGWTFGIFPYSTLASLASYFAIQAKRRRQLILQR